MFKLCGVPRNEYWSEWIKLMRNPMRRARARRQNFLPPKKTIHLLLACVMLSGINTTNNAKHAGWLGFPAKPRDVPWRPSSLVPGQWVCKCSTSQLLLCIIAVQLVREPACWYCWYKLQTIDMRIGTWGITENPLHTNMNKLLFLSIPDSYRLIRRSVVFHSLSFTPRDFWIWNKTNRWLVVDVCPWYIDGNLDRTTKYLLSLKPDTSNDRWFRDWGASHVYKWVANHRLGLFIFGCVGWCQRILPKTVLLLGPHKHHDQYQHVPSWLLKWRRGVVHNRRDRRHEKDVVKFQRRHLQLSMFDWMPQYWKLCISCWMILHITSYGGELSPTPSGFDKYELAFSLRQ